MDAVLGGRTRHVCVVLEDLHHAHNASACLRTCESLGVQDVHVIEGRHTWRPEAEVDQGASKWLTLRRHLAEPAAWLPELKAAGYQIIGTVVEGECVPGGRLPSTPDTLDLSSPVALVFGTEATGIAPPTLAACDRHLHLPMHGFTQSYNISVALALIVSGVVSRLRSLPVAWRLSEEERDLLRLGWCRQLLKRHHEWEREAMAEWRPE